MSVIVSASGKGDFRSVGAAVSEVAAHTRINVRPGIYREHVAVTKPLEIVGEGNREEIVIENLSADCLLLDTSHATIRNLTFRGGGRSTFEGNDAFYDPVEDYGFDPYCSVITIAQGQPLIEDCTLVARNIGVRFDDYVDIKGGELPRHRNDCELLPSVASVLLLPASKSEGEDRSFDRMTTHPTIRRCRLLGGDLGISNFPGIHSATDPTIIEDCQFSGQSMAVQVRHVNMRRCHLQGMKVGTGVHFYDGEMEDCTILHWHNGIAMPKQGKGIIRRCRIMQTNKKAIHVMWGNYVVDDSIIQDNALVGVRLDAGSGDRVVIRRCQIYSNKVAIQICQRGNFLVEDCNLANNELGSWYPLNLRDWVQRSGNQESNYIKAIFSAPPVIDSD